MIGECLQVLSLRLTKSVLVGFGSCTGHPVVSGGRTAAARLLRRARAASQMHARRQAACAIAGYQQLLTASGSSRASTFSVSHVESSAQELCGLFLSIQRAAWSNELRNVDIEEWEAGAKFEAAWYDACAAAYRRAARVPACVVRRAFFCAVASLG